MLASFYTVLALTEGGGAVWAEAGLSWTFVVTLLFWRRRIRAAAVVVLVLHRFERQR